MKFRPGGDAVAAAKERAKQKAIEEAKARATAAAKAAAQGTSVAPQSVAGEAQDSTGTLATGMTTLRDSLRGKTDGTSFESGRDWMRDNQPDIGMTPEVTGRVGARVNQPRTGSSGGGQSSGQFLDPQSEEWLRGLFSPTDTGALEAQAQRQNQEALGRGKADLGARGGMGGLGLAGGQIALGADMERQSANDLADRILGIQTTARGEDLKRGGIASEFLDRGIGRRLEQAEIDKDDKFLDMVLAQLGIGDEPPPGAPGLDGDTLPGGGQMQEGEDAAARSWLRNEQPDLLKWLSENLTMRSGVR